MSTTIKCQEEWYTVHFKNDHIREKDQEHFRDEKQNKNIKSYFC